MTVAIGGSLELLQEPFMQRALLGGLITGVLGGWVGSLAVLRQLSFFAEALGQAALLGISLALLLSWSPGWLLLLFALGFALLLRWLLRRSVLPADALLSLMCSVALALSVVMLSALPGARLSLQQLLFGDILGITWSDLLPLALLMATAGGIRPNTPIFLLPLVLVCCWRGWRQVSFSRRVAARSAARCVIGSRGVTLGSRMGYMPRNEATPGWGSSNVISAKAHGLVWESNPSMRLAANRPRCGTKTVAP